MNESRAAGNDETRAHSDEQDAEIAGAVTAIDAMVTVVDRFERYVYKTATRYNHSTLYRLNLLWVHAVAALLMAPLLSFTGHDGLTGPSFDVVRRLPGSPYSLAIALGIGGVVLGLGCIFRAKRTEMAGLILLAVYYTVFGVSFAVPPLRWLLLGHEPGELKPPFYSPVLYAHLTIIMVAHLRGLYFVLRDNAAIAAIPHTHDPCTCQDAAPPAQEGPTPP